MQREVMAPNVLKVEGVQPVKSSPKEVNWRGALAVDNKAGVVSIVMDLRFVNELRQGENGGYWRFASAEGIEKLLDLGKPDEDGNLHYKIVREGEGKGKIYFISRGDWENTAPEDSLRLHEPSIREAIKEGRPLAVYVYYGYGRLFVVGVYYGYSAARVAQNSVAGETDAPQGMLRKGQTLVVGELRIKASGDTPFRIEEF